MMNDIKSLLLIAVNDFKVLFLIVAVVLVVSLPTYFICKYKKRSYSWILFVNLSLLTNILIPLGLIVILLILPKLDLISKFPRGERMKNVFTMNKEDYVKKYSDDTPYSREKMKDEWQEYNKATDVFNDLIGQKMTAALDQEKVNVANKISPGKFHIIL